VARAKPEIVTRLLATELDLRSLVCRRAASAASPFSCFMHSPLAWGAVTTAALDMPPVLGAGAKAGTRRTRTKSVTCYVIARRSAVLMAPRRSRHYSPTAVVYTLEFPHASKGWCREGT
jgi:hypothetical protein